MVYIKKTLFLSIFVFIFTQLFSAVSLSADKAGLTAKSAIVVNSKNGKILYDENSRIRLPAASTVKILTAVIVAERLDFKQWVRISKRAAGITPTKAYLTENAKYRVKDLLQAFLMNSANDAGVALAEAVSGSEIKFARLMNKKAKELGAQDSFFLNATGLPENGKRQYATTYDLAVFMREFLTHPYLVKIMQTKRAIIIGTDHKKIQLRNHNKLLEEKAFKLIGKTGYTRAARHCFLGVFPKGRDRLIVAILGSRKPWTDLKKLIRRKY